MKLTLKNFRNHSQRQIAFGKTTALVGTNGSGKTAVLDALRIGLDGSLTADDIGPADTAAEVALEFDDGATVSRRRTASGLTVKVNGAKTTGASAAKYVEGKLGASIALAGAMLGQERWKSMSEKDIENAIFAALPIRLPADKVVSLAVECGLTPDGKGLLVELGLLSGDCGQKEWEAVYKTAFQMRTDVNREEKRLFIIVEAVKRPATDEAALRAALADIDEAIAEARSAAKAGDAVAAANEAALRAYRAALATHEHAAKAAADAARRRGELEARLAAMGSPVAPDPAAIAQAKENLDKCQRIRASYEARQAAAEGASAAAKAEEGNLGAGMCSAKADLACPHAQSLLQGARARKAAADKIAQDAAAYLATVRATEESWRKRLDELQAQDAAAKAADAVRAALAAITVPEIPAKPAPPTLAEPPKADEARLAALTASREATVRELADWERWKKNEVAVRDLAAVRERAAALDSIVKAFDPKGRLGALVVERVLAPLEGKANEAAKAIAPGLALRFAMGEKGLRILFRRSDAEPFRPMRAASNGEFILVVYLLMRVLGAVQSPGVVTLDNLDALDAEALAGLVKVMAADPTVQHAVIAAVAHDDTVAALASIPGVEVVKL